MYMLPWVLFFLPPDIISIIYLTLMGNTRFCMGGKKFLGRMLNICKQTQTITGMQKFSKQTHFLTNKGLWENALFTIIV